MEFIDKDIEAYAEKFSEDEPELLANINRETYAQMMAPRMLSGNFQGRLLSMFTKMLRPQYILEIGTFTAYSAICMAEGLPENGRLITIDIDEELESRVRKNIEKSGYSDKIEYKIGDAANIIPELDIQFDLVFIDADKRNYVKYYDLVYPKLKHGGVIIADNVLWSGKVLEEEQDKDTRAISAFNKKVKEDPRVEKVMLPVRDGLFIIRKK